MSTPTTCSVPHCNRTISARGLCVGHYNRWHRYGDTRPSVPLRPYGQTKKRKPPESPTALTGAWILNPHKRIHEYQEIN